MRNHFTQEIANEVFARWVSSRLLVESAGGVTPAGASVR